MIYTIKNRLQALEKVKKNTDIPEIVIIFWDEAEHHWIAKEQYIRKSSKGKIIPNTGRTRTIFLDNPDSYVPPEGFKGSILKEGVIE